MIGNFVQIKVTYPHTQIKGNKNKRIFIFKPQLSHRFKKKLIHQSGLDHEAGEIRKNIITLTWLSFLGNGSVWCVVIAKKRSRVLTVFHPIE